MDEILKNLTSPSWWVSALLAGFLMSLSAAYAKDFADKVLSFLSKRWAARSLKRKVKIDAEADKLIKDDFGRIETYLLEIRERIRLIFTLSGFILSALMMIIIFDLPASQQRNPFVIFLDTFFMVVVVISFFSFVSTLIKANEKGVVIAKLREKQNQPIENDSINKKTSEESKVL